MTSRHFKVNKVIAGLRQEPFSQRIPWSNEKSQWVKTNGNNLIQLQVTERTPVHSQQECVGGPAEKEPLAHIPDK